MQQMNKQKIANYNLNGQSHLNSSIGGSNNVPVHGGQNSGVLSGSNNA